MTKQKPPNAPSVDILKRMQTEHGKYCKQNDM